MAYQATVRWVIGQRSCNAWAARATQENKPFPQMDVDPARQQIDDVVAQILGLDPEWVDRVRRELTREPSVTDTRQAD